MEANEAPKKIYLPYKDGKLIGLVKTEGVKFNSGVDRHIEYVRKDAILEWAKIKQTQCLENSTAHAYFQMFIDKINCIELWNSTYQNPL